MWSADGTALYYVSDRGGAREPLDARPPARRGAAAGDDVHATAACSGRPSPTTAGTIVFERDFGIWTLDTATGAGARGRRSRGAARPPAPAVEHVRLTDQFQRARALARRQEGRVRRARRGLRRLGEGRRRRRARHDDARRRVAARLGARQPPPRLRLRARRRGAALPLRLRDERRDAADDAARRRRRAALLARRQAARLRARRHASCACSTSQPKQERVLATRHLRRARRSAPTARSSGRPTASWIAFTPVGDKALHATSTSSPADGRRGAAGQLPRQRRRRHGRVEPRRHVPPLRHGAAHRDRAARARRPHPAHAEVPRGSVPRPVPAKRRRARRRAAEHDARRRQTDRRRPRRRRPTPRTPRQRRAATDGRSAADAGRSRSRSSSTTSASA